jgi:hypothetical protein
MLSLIFSAAGFVLSGLACLFALALIIDVANNVNDWLIKNT